MKTFAVLRIMLGFGLAFVEYSSPHHGIVGFDYDEAVGFSCAVICIYLLCIWLVVSGVRRLRAVQP